MGKLTESVTLWFYKLNVYFVCNEIDKNMKTITVSMFLSGTLPLRVSGNEWRQNSNIQTFQECLYPTV